MGLAPTKEKAHDLQGIGHSVIVFAGVVYTAYIWHNREHSGNDI